MIILLVCFGIASVFWVLSILDQFHNSSINVALSFEGLPKASVFKKSPPRYIQVRLRAKGWDLMGHYMELRSTRLKVDLGSMENPNFLPNSILSERITKVLPADASIISLFPDHIELDFEKRAEKRVPVKAELKLSFAQQYNLNGPIILEPDSVLIVGAHSILDSIRDWSTQELVLEDLREAFNQELLLRNVAGLPITISESKVLIRIPVEEFTEASVEVDIDVQNLKKEYEIMLIPRKVRIKFQVALSDYDKVAASLFLAGVNFLNVDGGKNIKVDLNQAPGFVRNIQLDPEIVEYIIHK